jgi:hypothetical protein
MVIVWRGLGIIVPLSVFLISLLTEIVSEFICHDEQYYQVHGLPLAVALLLSSITIYACYRRYLPKNETWDGETKKYTKFINATHSFFFINMKYWALFILLCGIYTILVRGI